MKQIQVIKTDGTVEVLDKCPNLEGMQKIVGGYIEHVRVLDRIEKRDGQDFFVYTSMFVNDEGMIANLPTNAKATEVYLRNAREQIKRGSPSAAFSNLNNVNIHGNVLLFSGYTCYEVNQMCEETED